MTARDLQLFGFSRVSRLTRDIDIANLSVRPSVCLSVAFRFSMETVVIISSALGSPSILDFTCVKNLREI